jgi:hypothetical protein
MIHNLFRCASDADDLLASMMQPAGSSVDPSQAPKPKKKAYRLKKASLSKYGFRKVADDLLINLASEDFWSVSEDEKGAAIVRRIGDEDLPFEG